MKRTYSSLLSLLVTMSLYFAYGSNMDLHQMRVRCPSAVSVQTARLPGHRFIVNSLGVGSVVPDPASSVYGMTWTLTADDERSLDRYEGVERGLYRKTSVEVRTADGNKTVAMMYVATDPTRGKARTGYMERVITAAQACGLPRTYIEQLKPWLP